MKKLVVFTGAGVSADSGLATFRDSDGTWGNYRIEEVCIPEALDFNRRGVIRFYNERRAEMLKAEPNAAHRAIAGLERDFDVRVITQNVDNLHERAGSTHILHLHGELTKLRSTDDPSLILPFDGVEQGFDDRAPDGSLLRPHIVFFGEPVPEFDRAAELAAGADILMVVGTSLAVYPAASLVRCVRPDIPVYVVDPGRPAIRGVRNPLEVIRKRAAEGVPELADRLRAACAEGRSESLLPGKADPPFPAVPRFRPIPVCSPFSFSRFRPSLCLSLSVSGFSRPHAAVPVGSCSDSLIFRSGSLHLRPVSHRLVWSRSATHYAVARLSVPCNDAVM